MFWFVFLQKKKHLNASLTVDKKNKGHELDGCAQEEGNLYNTTLQGLMLIERRC